MHKTKKVNLLKSITAQAQSFTSQRQSVLGNSLFSSYYSQCLASYSLNNKQVKHKLQQGYVEHSYHSKYQFSNIVKGMPRQSKVHLSKDISGQTVFVSGAASGMGEASAIGFAEQGCNLILVDMVKDRLDKVKDIILEEFPVKIHLEVLDVTKLDDVKKLFENLPQEFQQIDILFNNVGTGQGLGAVHKCDIEEVYKMIDINVKSMMAITRIVTPQMVERNSGHVINMASMASQCYYPDFAAYCASKHAVQAFTLCMQHDFLKHKIRCTNINPGYVKSRFFDNLDEEVKTARQSVDQMEGSVTPTQVADAIIYCATRPDNVNITDIQVQHVYEAGTEHALKQK